MESEVPDVSIPAYAEDQLANPDFCIGKRKDSYDNVALIGMKILLHIEVHGARSALRTHLGYLKESYDTALFWHQKAMSLGPNSDEDIKKGRKWKKHLVNKYEHSVTIANVYQEVTVKSKCRQRPALLVLY